MVMVAVSSNSRYEILEFLLEVWPFLCLMMSFIIVLCSLQTVVMTTCLLHQQIQ